MATDQTYPIAEIFFSTQGEGGESGKAMVFVRLAGCSVGRRYHDSRYEGYDGLGDFPMYPVFVNECTTYDGRHFPCDTDYRSKQRLTKEGIVLAIQKEHKTCKNISITGGEPLIHDLRPLLKYLIQHGYKLHLETSGTHNPTDQKINDMLDYFDYVVVSPKFPFVDNFAEFATEIRLLVDEDFDWNKLPESIKVNSKKVWVSPVNNVSSLDMENAQRCLAILETHPEVRLSLQIHKLLKVR